MIRYSRVKRIHFVGIGGAGMSGIAEVLNNMGFEISGSDISSSETVERLRKSGIAIYIGHSKENVKDIETLVYSSAVTNKNIEVETALGMKIPVISRAEMLAELMRVKFSIAVAGTHGKTSTTSMIACILNVAKKDPTYVVGGKLKTGESGAKLGKSNFLVAEADESDGSFLKLFPTIAVVTNIEDDHLDHYGSVKNLLDAFANFGNKVPFFGSVVLNSDCVNSKKIISKINKRVITFGISGTADISAGNITSDSFGSEFSLSVFGKESGTIKLNVGGYHNILNALGAITATLESGIDIDTIKKGLGQFSLPDRRFQILYNSEGIIVVDDYAHHPTEIKATLKMLKSGNFNRVIAVFQPHRFTRLKNLMNEFAQSFGDADLVILTKVYSANQKEIKGVNSKVLREKILESGHKSVLQVEETDNILSYLIREIKDGDAVVFLSAGDLTKAAHKFGEKLEREKK